MKQLTLLKVLELHFPQASKVKYFFRVRHVAHIDAA